MRKMTNLADYTSVLPYDSEVFGVYQPLLGWRSQKIQDRITAGYHHDLVKAVRQVTARMTADVAFTTNADHSVTESAVHPASLSATGNPTPTTFIFDSIRQKLPDFDGYTNDVWDSLASNRQLEKLLNDEIVPKIVEFHRAAQQGHREEQGTPTTAFESITKTPQTITDQDEISEAVKQDNKADTKFGMNANAHQGPLQGGFRAASQGDFEVFDQWVEVLPTDQVVPAEVAYDPISGRQVRP
ncbi:MAG: hypothetical protein H7146_08250 [Burkholderiaceae bacterium]|nr:hypothetical protein [Microbacteriaceae bacterium]